jgi:hypothetical protein
MPEFNIPRLRTLVSQTLGPTPWYWKAFPSLALDSGLPLTWTHHGSEGPLAYLVSLSSPESAETPLLALNSYCRPFLVPPANLGVWCPEGRSIRIVCFDPDRLKPFELAEIAGWFKQSSDRIYAATAPVAEIEIPLALPAGVHAIEVPPELRNLPELIAPTSYPAKSINDPAFALYAMRLQEGLVQVLPQRWFTAAQYEVGRRWIPRATRDPESRRIVGECFGTGIFLLREDGEALEEWLERTEP